ncbi:hypothetical protein TEA_014886 [Camellia sinensis var. sinensis]|uniref:Glucose-methanol-choline oxidoreductase N-terminal domain-containing protein n=1 Tax=Camellia sinensis var. sinensis TaxID=542762 RepID=A0A4S4E1U4_CAMSN|nr:hypothetical protein TEA_014886 [Camellia sinensis var. sinensis]
MSSRLRWNFIATALLGILFLLDSCFSENAPYPTFARDATLAPAEIFYDYIIIGGGTAGCALAATLSQGANVLVLERGGLPYGNPAINNMDSFAETLANISPSSPSQPFISTDGVSNARARVLGGGTCLNAGFYTRASTAYVGRVGWDQKLVNDSYEWVENKVVFRPPMLEWQSAVRDGLLEVGMLPDNGFTYDHIYGTKVGGTIFDQDGHRHTAADLLEYADPTKITVYLNAVVHQIFFGTTAGQAKPKAEGVAFRDANGKMHRAYLNKGSSMNEIILSAGALGSPQLLMLSGIGPQQHLMAHGIKVLMDQPMVGQGMADNPMNAVFIPAPTALAVSLIQVVGIPQSDSYYIETASGSFFGSTIPQMFANQSRHACRFFLWVDPPLCPHAREIIPGLLRRTTMLKEQLKMHKLLLFQALGMMEIKASGLGTNEDKVANFCPFDTYVVELSYGPVDVFGSMHVLVLMKHGGGSLMFTPCNAAMKLKLG